LSWRNAVRLYSVSLGTLILGLTLGYGGLGDYGAALTMLSMTLVWAFDWKQASTLYSLFPAPARLWHVILLLAFFLPWGYTIYICRAGIDLHRRARVERQVQYEQLLTTIKHQEHDLFGS
jgi:hypothetical protein